MISERLLRKHHNRAGVDRQGQPVIQVHVLQPVVIDLNKNIWTLFEKCWFVGQKLLLSEWRPVCSRVKTHYSVSLPDWERVGESRRERGSLVDFTELDVLWTDRSPRCRRRDWGTKGGAEAWINLYCQVIHFFQLLNEWVIYSLGNFILFEAILFSSVNRAEFNTLLQQITKLVLSTNTVSWKVKFNKLD